MSKLVHNAEPARDCQVMLYQASAVETDRRGAGALACSQVEAAEEMPSSEEHLRDLMST